MPLEVKAGDRVLFGKYAGSEVKIGDEEYLIMREDDILGIIEG
jgi:chaperonin GroES